MGGGNFSGTMYDRIEDDEKREPAKEVPVQAAPEPLAERTNNNTQPAAE